SPGSGAAEDPCGAAVTLQEQAGVAAAAAAPARVRLSPRNIVLAPGHATTGAPQVRHASLEPAPRTGTRIGAASPTSRRSSPVTGPGAAGAKRTKTRSGRRRESGDAGAGARASEGSPSSAADTDGSGSVAESSTDPSTT